MFYIPRHLADFISYINHRGVENCAILLKYVDGEKIMYYITKYDNIYLYVKRTKKIVFGIGIKWENIKSIKIMGADYEGNFYE